MRFGLVFVTDYEGTERELYCWFKYIMSIMYIVCCRRERSDKNWSTIRKRRHEKKQSNTANQLEYFNVLFFTFIIFMFCYTVFFYNESSWSYCSKSNCVTSVWSFLYVHLRFRSMMSFHLYKYFLVLRPCFVPFQFTP